jgi:hypothetical protein
MGERDRGEEGGTKGGGGGGGCLGGLDWQVGLHASRSRVLLQSGQQHCTV